MEHEDSSIENMKLHEMSSEQFVTYVKEMVRNEVRQQSDATIMMTEEATTSVKKPKFVEANILLEETVPAAFLGPLEKKKRVFTGHRSNVIDLLSTNGKRYYNVSVMGEPESNTPYGAGSKFLIYFSDNAQADDIYGLNAQSNLFCVPIKENRLENAFNEVLSTYTPGSNAGLEKLKTLPFCRDVPSADDASKSITPVTDQMRVFSSTRTPEEQQQEFNRRLKEGLGLREDDDLPPSDQLVEILREQPELFDKAKKGASNNEDRPSVVLTKEGMVMAHPRGAARMSMSEVGFAIKGRFDMAEKPQLPMDPIGVGSVELPLDILPQGNVMIPHPKKLPALDELLTFGVTIVRMVSAIKTIGTIIKGLAEIQE